MGERALPVKGRNQRPSGENFAPFPGPDWEDEDDLMVEWDEDWAWDADEFWEAPAAAGPPGRNDRENV